MTENQTILSTMSDEVSVQTSVGAVIYPNDSENLEQIFDHLCDDMRRLSNDINRQYRGNQPTTNPATNAEKTVVMQELNSLLEKKTSVINKLTAHVKDSKAHDFPHFKGEATLSIPEMMARECDSIQQAIVSLEKTKEENDKYLKELKELTAFCEEMSQTSVESGKDKDMLRKISSLINKDSKQCKKDLETVISNLFPDLNFMGVLTELLDKATSGGGWCEFENPEDYVCLEYLINVGFVETSANNVRQVRLKDGLT